MMVMVMMMAMPHRAEGITHPPAAESAEGEDPGAIVPVERAGEQPDNRGQHNDR